MAENKNHFSKSMLNEVYLCVATFEVYFTYQLVNSRTFHHCITESSEINSD